MAKDILDKFDGKFAGGKEKIAGVDNSTSGDAIQAMLKVLGDVTRGVREGKITFVTMFAYSESKEETDIAMAGKFNTRTGLEVATGMGDITSELLRQAARAR